ncbi:MAG: homocysteine S-methyltransferase family protein [Alphaproteobacteria bacterium]
MAVLLDGGMGGELMKRGWDSPTIWSARALIEAPQVVRDLHREFIDAGATVITTSNYSCTPKILAREGHGAHVAALVARARDVANEARDGHGEVKVAGSLPPLVGTYDPDLVEPRETMRPVYDEIAGTLAPGVDLFICESMTTGIEARTAAEAAAATGKPVWVSYILMDSGSNRIRSGETIGEAIKALDGIAIEAVLFNCCSPEAIGAALPELKRSTKARCGGYANAFRPIPDEYRRERDGRRSFRDDVDPPSYARAVRSWLASGAEIVGGCCGTGPAHIRAIAQVLDEA